LFISSLFLSLVFFENIEISTGTTVRGFKSVLRGKELRITSSVCLLEEVNY